MSGTQRLSDERLAEIRALMEVGGPSMSWVTAEAIIDLLGEVERLRARNDALENVYGIAAQWLASDADEVSPDYAWQLADAVKACGDAGTER